MGRSNLAGEASRGEPASRNASEPGSASLHQSRAASLPDLRKPDTRREAMGASTGGALRGERGRRVGTDRSRNLGDPAGWGSEFSNDPRERHNPGSGPVRESDWPIVAKKRVTTVERRGRNVSASCKKGRIPLGLRRLRILWTAARGSELPETFSPETRTSQGVKWGRLWGRPHECPVAKLS